jgi:hypothetical protein
VAEGTLWIKGTRKEGKGGKAEGRRFDYRILKKGCAGGGGRGGSVCLIGKLKIYGYRTADKTLGIVQSLVVRALCSCVAVHVTGVLGSVCWRGGCQRAYIGTYIYTCVPKYIHMYT